MEPSSNSRPVRASRNFFYYSTSNANVNANFTGPVRKWEKKWVHVSSSRPSTAKQRKPSNGPNSPILLCKWTPLSRSTTDDSGDKASGDLPRRKFRYTPITVVEEQKKLAAKRVADKDKSGEARPAKRLAVESDEIYGMDINHDLMGAHQEANKSLNSPRYSNRNLFNLEEPEH